MWSRREFLTRSSLIAFAPLVPQFLARTALAVHPKRNKVLVVLEMAGGNDGLNTVIPYADALYYKNRPTLGVPKKEVLRIDDSVGLHPSLTALQALLQEQQLAVV